MQRRTDLTRPTWATTHDLTDGGICWYREVKTDLPPDFAAPLRVLASTSDEFEVDDDGGVTINRQDEVTVMIDSEEVTLDQAREFARAILSVVDAVVAAETHAAATR
jgi:hypothetical protein